MTSTNRTFEVVSEDGRVPSTLTPDEKAYEEELLQGLTTMQLRSNCRRMVLLPNFDFSWLLPPTTGFIAEFDLGSLFNSDPFRTFKYNIFLKAKIQFSPASLTTERHKEIEHGLRVAFPWVSASQLSLESTAGDGWTPYFHSKGCSIGIYHSTEKDIAKNDTTDTYYIIAHTSLPRLVVNQLQVQEEHFSSSNDKYTKLVDSNSPIIPDDVRPYTYQDVFGPGSAQEKALSLAIENATRLVAVFASVIDVQLVQPLYSEDNEVYLPSETDIPAKFNKEGMLSECLSWWPKDLPIYPFTILPSTEIDNSLGVILPKHLYSFPLGQVLDQLRASKPKDFELLLEKKGLEFKYKIERFTPDVVTDYNTYRVKGQQLVFYSGCTDTRSSEKGVLVYEGLELGFKHLNCGSSSFQWINQYSNSYPVLFPSLLQDQKKVKQDTITKCFTLTQGGISPTTRLLQPVQTKIVYSNLQQLQAPHVCNALGTTGLPLEELVPDKVLLSTHSLDISRF